MTPTRVSLLLAPAFIVAASGCGAQGGDPAGCEGRGFALSLARDTGGQATPVAAANWFSSHGEMAGFEGPWRVVRQTDGGATLRSDAAQLHTVQGSDGTWQVDSGSCG